MKVKCKDYIKIKFKNSDNINTKLLLDNKSILDYPELLIEYNQNELNNIYSIKLPVSFLRKIKKVEYEKQVYRSKIVLKCSGYKFFRKMSGIDNFILFNNEDRFHRVITEKSFMMYCKNKIMFKAIGYDHMGFLYDDYKKKLKDLKELCVKYKMVRHYSIILNEDIKLSYKVLIEKYHKEYNRIIKIIYISSSLEDIKSFLNKGISK